MARFGVSTKVLKVEKKLGLVLGWGITCTQKNEPYYDLQGDHIPDDAMLEAAADFMAKAARPSTDMHTWQGETPVRDGDVVFAFPLTREIAKCFGIECETTGLLVAVRPSPAVLAKFESGEYTGFSIGGRRLEDVEVTS